MYRGAVVLFGTRMERENPFLELGLPCVGGPPYYLAQRMERRNPGLELGWRDSSSIWRRGERKERSGRRRRRRRRSGLHRRNLATPTPEGGEKIHF